jgi:hypothetical protein
MKFRACLKLVKARPELANIVGLKVLTNRTFAANAVIYADFVGLKANSVRLGWRTHRLRRCGAVSSQWGSDFVDRRHWNIHEATHDLFDETSEGTFQYERHPGRSTKEAVKDGEPMTPVSGDSIIDFEELAWDLNNQDEDF